MDPHSGGVYVTKANSLNFSFFFLLMFIYLFIYLRDRERERERENTSRGGTKREGVTEFEAGSRL